MCSLDVFVAILWAVWPDKQPYYYILSFAQFNDTVTRDSFTSTGVLVDLNKVRCTLPTEAPAAQYTVEAGQSCDQFATAPDPVTFYCMYCIFLS